MTKANAAGVVLSAMTDADVEAIGDLAREIWLLHYPGIITREQIDYMLVQRYAADHLRYELTQPDIQWRVARRDGAAVGFSASVYLAASHELKLDKLYVHPQAQRGGVGRMLMDAALARAEALQCRNLILAVNKQNEKAIAAYRAYGFAVREAVTVDIGGGFVMDDFIMARSLQTLTASGKP